MSSLKLEINKNPGRAYYREVVNIVNQYKNILKNPTKKIRNLFTDFLLYIMVTLALLGILILLTLVWGFDWLMAIAIILMAILTAVGVLYLINLDKILNGLIKEHKNSIITIDEQGIIISVADQPDFTIGWDQLVFVRCFKESVCFFPKPEIGFAISAPSKFKEEILDYLKSEKPNVFIANQ